MFRFAETFASFMSDVSKCEKGEDVGTTILQIEADFTGADGGDFDKKACLDHVLRKRVSAVVSAADGPPVRECHLRAALQLSVGLARAERCSPTTPIVLLADSFDALPLDGAQALFAFVEENVATWKEETFFNACKNNLLRMCNDLLRRLSRSQNTVFCGRILLFLAKFFPLSERSGLNVISEFNLDNLTAFGDGGDELADAEDADDGEAAAPPQPQVSSGPPLDYNLYRKFWALQDFFRNPNQCYSKVPWKAFNAYTTDVLAAFSGFRLDESSGSHSSQLGSEESQQYFAKYLTSQKLLQLQLSDAMFRRYVLVQFLILFQYLTSQVKFKSETQSLSEAQQAWVRDTQQAVYRLMAETPPQGQLFADTIRSILKREENWNAWKNDGCPAFKPPAAEETPPEPAAGRPAPRRRPKRKVGDVLRHAEAKKKFLMGHPELTRLWNVCPDNMEACKTSKRDFLPPLDTFFDEAITQMDPATMVEDQYKVINNGDYGWRALRLLARRSPHFFAAAQKIPNSLPDYLDTILKKVANDIPKFSGGNGAGDASLTAADETVADGAAEAEELRAEEAPEEAAPARRVHRLTEPLAGQLAARLGADWKRLASRLGFQSDEVDYFVSEQPTAEAQAAMMFRQWMDNEREEATQEELLYALEAVKLDTAVRELFDPEVRGETDAPADS
ncbi:THO complex subunit 1-like [Pollicipes pollicipes]|uniref:THO complex subunit 1-like n=1 Tax=Pollicipes pollicipes TaxID=41117 RepID=UPI001884D38A|nr:THO complex subunit 1-like [Pollicipes pollicipes]